MGQDELRENLVGGHSFRGESRGPDRGADQQEQGKLADHHDAGADQRDAGSSQRAGCEQALHDEVVGAMGGGRQERAADQTAGEGIRPGDVKGRDDDLELSGSGGGEQTVLRAAGEFPGDHQCSHTSSQVYGQLNHIGPHHRLEPAEPGVDEGDATHGHDSRRDAPPGQQREGDGTRKNANAIAQKSGAEKDHRYHTPGGRPEARLQPGVGGLLVPAKIPGQQPDRDADPADQVAKGELKKRQVAASADSRHRDHGQGRGFGRNDRKKDRPRREISGAEEIVAGRLLAARRPQPYPERNREVQRDDDEVCCMQRR